MIEEIEQMIIHSADFQNRDFYSKWYDNINELIIAEDVCEIPARAFRHFYGTKKVKILSDGWTTITSDRKKSAHFEHTILITDDGCEILTQL